MSLSMETLKREVKRATDRAFGELVNGGRGLHDLMQANFILGVMVGRGFDVHSREGIYLTEGLTEARRQFEGGQ